MIRKKCQGILLLILFVGFCQVASAQELFVFSEPASNMAAKGVGLRLTAMPMKNYFSKKTDLFSNVEAMLGINKNLMLHSELYLSNVNSNAKINGVGFYGKYRFFTNDAVHRHFRLAALGRVTLIDGLPAKTPFNLTANNSGLEAGIVATQLIKKYAFSAGVSYLQGWNNGSFKLENSSDNRHSFGYNIAVGRLVLPKEYVSYDQLNVNLMLEGLGQLNSTNGKQFFDLAPSIQFIIKSKMRVDVGYRYRITENYNSTHRQSFLLRFEYNWFNVW